MMQIPITVNKESTGDRGVNFCGSKFSPWFFASCISSNTVCTHALIKKHPPPNKHPNIE